MQEYKHQQLINNYQLDVSQMPEYLRSAVYGFLDHAAKAESKLETRLLLEKMDDNLCINIIQWVKGNEDKLNTIICEDCSYKQFYYILFTLFLKDGFEQGWFYGHPLQKIEGKDILYRIEFASETDFSECSYFHFICFEILGEDKKEYIQNFIFRACPDLKTVEPLYYYNRAKDLRMKVYNFTYGEGEPNYEIKKEVDKYFKEYLEDVLKRKIIFIKLPVYTMIEQLTIALNPN